MKTDRDYSECSAQEKYVRNFIKLFGTIGNDDRFKGYKNRLQDECTGFYFVDSGMIWFTYIDKKDGMPYDSTLEPQRYLETNVESSAKKGF